MNKIRIIFKSKFTYFFLLTVIAFCAIWYAQPEMIAFKHRFIMSVTVQIILSAIILIAWLNYLIIKIFLRTPFQGALKVASTRKDFDLEYEHTVYNQLNAEFGQATQMAKKTRPPWVLLIGPPGSGKTSLLSRLPFKLTSATESLLNRVKSTQLIDFWVSEQAVFIDPAGKYALADMDDPSEQIVWRSLIKILKKNPRISPLNQVILVIDTATLFNTNDAIFNDLIEHLIYQLQLLKSLEQNLKVILLITHSDRLAGFSEFFDDLSDSERNQPFGFNISADKKDLAEQVEGKFEEFVKNLSARSFWRIHHEHSLHKRGRIQEFPLQIEKLGQRLKIMATQLPWSTSLKLSGIFFVSSSQNNAVIDFLHNLPVTKAFGLQTQQQTTVYHEQHAYFIEELITHILIEAKYQQRFRPRNTRKQIYAYLGSVIVIMALTWVWHENYQKNIGIVSSVLANLKSPAELTPDSVALPWLHSLNVLSQSINTVQKNDHPINTLTGLDQSQKLLVTMRAQYKKQLTATLFPYLISSLMTTMEQNKHHNDVALYAALKTYLMLSENKQVDENYIQSWFKLYWSQQFNNDLAFQSELARHLQAFLQFQQSAVGSVEPISWPINEVLVSQVQNELRQLPLANQLFLQLQDQYPQAPVSILTDLGAIDNIDLSQAKVCSFCTTDQFQEIYSKIIPKIAKDTPINNWVYRQNKEAHLSPLAQENLISELRTLYLTYYKEQWGSALLQISIIPAQSISQAQHNIALLNNPSSQFWKILNIIYDNMTLNQISEANNVVNNPNSNVAILQNFLNPESSESQQFHANLVQLSDYLFHLNQITEIDKASYEAAVKRFESNGNNDPITQLLMQAQQAPTLIQPWLQSIAKGAWQAILLNAHQYLNTIWTTTIIPEYQQGIDKRYPIFQDAPEYIALDDFNHFFGPAGMIEQFFNQYLKPFVNMEQNYWTFKSLNEETINISQNVLDMFIRASMIQQMFYSDNPQKFSINFSLIPMRLSSNTNAFTLNLGSQVVQFNREERNEQEISWPPPATFVTLLFSGVDGNTPSFTLSGPWALFKLLNQSQIEATKNPREYEVKFALKDYSADYFLMANHLINPFIPGVLDKFRCPLKL